MNSSACNWAMKPDPLHEPSVDNHGHEAAAGLGRRPAASPRWSPHFRAGWGDAGDGCGDAADAAAEGAAAAEGDAGGGVYDRV